MLPPRIRDKAAERTKKANRTKRWISRAHCDFVRSHSCIVEGCAARPIEVAHVRKGSDAGTGRKPSDYHTVSLCQMHHAEQHAIGEDSFAMKYNVNLAHMAEAFAKASPKAAEIRKVREA